VPYLCCPVCSGAFFERYPFATGRKCPRCSERHGRSVTLKPMPHYLGAASITLRDTDPPPGEGR